MKNNVIDFEQHKPVILSPVPNDNGLFSTFVDADGQKYVPQIRQGRMSFIPLFDDTQQMLAYEKKYGNLKRRLVANKRLLAVSEAMEDE
mgnify:CR=1 FL=1